MRPVERGELPRAADGQAVLFREYRDAREALIERMGDYCSYCEMPKPEGPHVEHIQSKKLHPNREREWENFLLGCQCCNGIKGCDDPAEGACYWPNRDNTFRAFEYRLDLPPQPAPGLTPEQQVRARRTLELTGLDRVPGHPKHSERDRRWKKRNEAWKVALRARENLEAADNEMMRATIVEVSIGRGFWSVWMTVFRDDLDMCRRFRSARAFPGTAVDCWNEEGLPIARPGGAI